MNNKYSPSFTFIQQHFHFCVFTIFILSQKSHSVDPFYEACAPINCGQHNITYPFYIQGQNSSCGFPGFELNCTNDGLPILHLDENNYIVDRIFNNNRSVRVYNAAVLSAGTGRCLPQIKNLSLVADNRFSLVNHLELVLLANCSTNLPSELLRYRVECGVWNLAILRGDEELGVALEECEVNVAAPVEVHGGDGAGEYVELMRRGFLLNWTATDCSECEGSGGRCGFDHVRYHFSCFCTDRPHLRRCQSSKSNSKVILATVIPGGFIITICALVFIVWRRHKWNYVTYLLSRNTSSDPSSNEDLEGGSIYFEVPVFSYRELEEATKNFDPSKELGDGGFGTVYHGKLRDGREVAVKRLYEHNYKRVEQFMNEVQILTRMRHQNLVLLYGCTSRRSRELLLVYEYIPNGTVADHLHGDRVRTGSLTWPIRMNIAIETASALAYLHASNIIHRDVKTNNILLDANFCVKVADFGLSRLFPNDVTHVSTAPQGTPGYVDPEYHQCYQLTDKSDVYSFGVVLIELISSMPAVDISRHRDEINLANLAINKIQKSAFHELIDPCLGFESDGDVERMTTSVAELAFRCLQLEKEMRPKMQEVLEALKGIKGDDDEYKVEKTEEGDDYGDGVLKNVRPPPSPESDVVVLLKNSKAPPSPDTVTAKWVSSSSSSTIPVTSN